MRLNNKKSLKTEKKTKTVLNLKKKNEINSLNLKSKKNEN